VLPGTYVLNVRRRRSRCRGRRCGSKRGRRPRSPCG
jgi:hypothetical protein